MFDKKKKVVEHFKKEEDWMSSKWRPMMGWMYMLVCVMDMIVFPILWSFLQTMTHTQITQWNPLTLQGAGLFHIAMGAVLGIAAFGRTQEKLSGTNNGGLQTNILPSEFTAPSLSSAIPTFQQPRPFNTPTSTGFGNEFNNTPATDFNQPLTAKVGFGGKLAPPIAPQPFI